LIDKFKGCLKNTKDNDLRRIIIKMLLQKVLKEKFVKINYQGGLAVYLMVGKNHSSVLKNETKIMIS